MYEDRQNQSERIIYSWKFKSIYCDVVQGQSWYAWSINLFVCEMAIRISALHKQKRTWIKLTMYQWENTGSVWIQKPRTKHCENWTRKINSTALLENSGKAPQVRLLTK